MKEIDKVSVIIPTYKRPDTIKRAVDSVINQTYQNVEVIVVDDNPPESEERKRTQTAMSEYKNNPKVSYILHPQNKNGSAARNTGLRNANGEFIMFLDDDDEFLPEKVERQLKVMQDKDETWGASYAGFEKIYKNKTTHSANYREGNLLVDALMRNIFIAAGSNLMIRKSVCEEIGFFNETFPRNQDLEFLVRILQKYKIAHCDYIGLRVYAHYGLNVDFERVTNLFLENFAPYINQLKPNDQERVSRMINLQLLRYRFSKRKYKDAMYLFTSGKVRIWDSIRYTSYLMKRYLNSTIESFNL